MLGTGHHRHVGFLCDPAGDGFIAHLLYSFRRRADELNSSILAGRREVRVLREETVAGMNGIRPGLFHGVYEGFYIQIALTGGRWPNVDGFVGVADMEGFGICVGVDGDCGYL